VRAVVILSSDSENSDSSKESQRDHGGVYYPRPPERRSSEVAVIPGSTNPGLAQQSVNKLLFSPCLLYQTREALVTSLYQARENLVTWDVLKRVSWPYRPGMVTLPEAGGF